MEDTNSYCYCDKCGKRIDRDSNFEHQESNLCVECATKLYRKIFGNTEADKQ